MNREREREKEGERIEGSYIAGQLVISSMLTTSNGEGYSSSGRLAREKRDLEKR